MGCSPTQPQTQKLEGMAQGTTYHITYWSNEAVDNQLIETAIKTTFEDIDKNISNYRPDSVIEAFNANQSTKSQEVGAESIALVRLAQSVHE
jgi:thiamine biosynthesis lipoprotein